MSQSREKKRRYNLRLEYINRFCLWLSWEPPIWMFWRWHQWKKNKPVWDDSREPFAYEWWKDWK